MTAPDPRERMDELEHAIGDYPRLVADLTEKVAQAARQTVTGHDAGGLVTVTASADGEIRDVRVSLRAVRDLDERRLAQCVQDAANAALERAERLLAEATALPSGGEDDVDRRMDAFERRMDDMLYELDRMDRRLDRFGE